MVVVWSTERGEERPVIRILAPASSLLDAEDLRALGLASFRSLRRLQGETPRWSGLATWRRR